MYEKKEHRVTFFLKKVGKVEFLKEKMNVFWMNKNKCMRIINVYEKKEHTEIHFSQEKEEKILKE